MQSQIVVARVCVMAILVCSSSCTARRPKNSVWVSPRILYADVNWRFEPDGSWERMGKAAKPDLQLAYACADDTLIEHIG